MVEKLESILKLLEQKVKLEAESFEEIEHLQPHQKFDEINGLLN